MKLRAAILGVLLLAGAPIDAREPLTMRVWPAVSSEPASVIIRVSVEPDPDNRAIMVVAESADFFRSSQLQLDGDRSSRTNVLEYRGLPAGAYEIRGILVGSRGQERSIARATVTVVSGGESLTR